MVNQKTPLQKQIQEFCREARGDMKQKTWGQKIGLSLTSVHNFEHGESYPSLTKLELMAKCVGKKVVITFEDL